jgi:hypothetical protein
MHSRPERSSLEPETARFSFATPTRIGLWAGLASAGIGLFFALFQVQGWKVPKPLALALIVVLLAVIAGAVSMIAFEIWRAGRRFLEHRATSPSWVASEAPGLLDYEADGLRAIERFSRELNKIAEDTVSLGKRLDRHTRRIVRLQGKSAKRRQRAANRSAKSINKSAIYIEKRVALLRALVKDIDRNYSGLIASQEIETEADFETAVGFRNILDTGRTATTEALASVTEYRVSTQETEALNLSRTVRNASKRLAKALIGMETIFKNYEKSSAGLVRDFDRKLEEWRRRASRGDQG